MKSFAYLLIAVAAVLMPGCKESSNTDSRSPAMEVSPQPVVDNQNVDSGNSNGELKTPNDVSAEDFIGSTSAVEKKINLRNAALLNKVRTGKQANFDRLVLEFAGADIPGYHIEYSDKPAQFCGSGDDAPLKVRLHLEIRLNNTNAHDFKGNDIVSFIRDQSTDLPVIKQIKLTCDFEAQVELAVGVVSRNAFRVLELKDPTRLVIDVKH
jgi:hypothetical protein